MPLPSVQSVWGWLLLFPVFAGFILLVFVLPTGRLVQRMHRAKSELPIHGKRLLAVVIEQRFHTIGGTSTIPDRLMLTLWATGTHPLTGQPLTFMVDREVAQCIPSQVNDTLVMWVSLPNPNVYLPAFPLLSLHPAPLVKELRSDGVYIVAVVTEIAQSELDKKRTTYLTRASGMYPPTGQTLIFQAEATRPPEYHVGEPMNVIVSRIDPSRYILGR
ncbi:MAG: hypothetical protein H0X24_08610 [Ktedonobacterales bacterium]|nr:hypothetical protein [Ktedonobacterales bacterium]